MRRGRSSSKQGKHHGLAGSYKACPGNLKQYWQRMNGERDLQQPSLPLPGRGVGRGAVSTGQGGGSPDWQPWLLGARLCSGCGCRGFRAVSEASTRCPLNKSILSPPCHVARQGGQSEQARQCLFSSPLS